MVDAITYIACLAESARRFAMGLEPFDFGNANVVEALYYKNIYFLEHEDDSSDVSDRMYQEAHQQYVISMVEAGWRLGPEDYANQTMPDLKPYAELTDKEKEGIAFRAAMVHSARDFYRSLSAQIKTDLMDVLDSLDYFSKRNMLFSSHAEVVSHMTH